MVKNTVLIFLVLLFASTVDGQQKRKITDMIGREVTVPASINKVYTDRFASLIVFAIDSKILCNSTFSVKDEAKKLISSDYYSGKPLSEGEDEVIIAMKPDLIVFGNMGGINVREEADDTQRKLKIPVVVVNFRIEDYKSMYVFLGKTLGRETQTQALVDYLDKYIYPVSEKIRTIPEKTRPSVYYAEGAKGMNTEPSGSFHSQILDFVKAKNVAETSLGDVHGMSSVSMEQILLWNPEIILVWTGMPMTGSTNAGQTYKYITTDSLWGKLKAVKNKKVYQVPSLPFGWFDRPPTTNIIPGVLWAAKTLYPNMFSFDFNLAVKEYFRLFYHISISDSDIEMLTR